MKPLAEVRQAQLSGIRVLLTDIDDTMTVDGRLPSGSLAAMERLEAIGVRVIPVTGRPAGWCDHIARMWPVSAVVGENGAFYFRYDRQARKMSSVFSKDAAERDTDRMRLDALGAEVLRRFPGAGLASDQNFRIADLAIDFCEDVGPLSESDVAGIVAYLRAAGATCKVSSIHVNAWFGKNDKLTMAQRCLQDCCGIEQISSTNTIVFIGDSPNDEPMFEYFPFSVGVANVKRYALGHEPAWVTTAESAAGFQELADAIIRAKSECKHETKHRME